MPEDPTVDGGGPVIGQNSRLPARECDVQEGTEGREGRDREPEIALLRETQYD
jgi:hypothetical protein